MKIRLLIWIPATLVCSTLNAQDTPAFGEDTLFTDSQWETFGTPVDYNIPLPPSEIRLSDSIMRGVDTNTTAEAISGQPICVSETVYLCLPEISALPVIELTPTPAASYMWYWTAPPHRCVYEECLESSCYTLDIIDPYENSIGLSMTDSAPVIDSCAVVLTETRPKEITTVPPVKEQKPSQPVSIPTHDWFEAILPATTRSRRSS